MLSCIERYLPKELLAELGGWSGLAGVEELRFRADRPVMAYGFGQEYTTAFCVNADQIGEILFSLSEHSLHSFMDELRQGFFTIQGGVRIGVAGRVVSERGVVKLIRNYTSLNIRFPREIKGIHKKLFCYLASGRRLENTLILSPPRQGKTTLVRDLIRAVSDGEIYAPQTCTVVDEREEIAGGGHFNLGLRTDVLSACPKSEGMLMALRSLGPDVIATDEIGSDEDLRALGEAVNSGVTVLATAHCRNLRELEERLFFKELLGTGIVKRIVFLSDSLGRGTVQQVFNAKRELLNSQPFLLEEEKDDI